MRDRGPGAALLLLGGGTVAAARTGDTAPAGSASGSVVNLDFFQTCVSCTGAHAGTRRPHGEASAIRLVGREVAGGASASEGSQRGALVALPANPFISLAIAAWRTGSAADTERPTSFSHSRAALLDLALLGDAPADSLLTVALLESTSDATSTGEVSRGEGSPTAPMSPRSTGRWWSCCCTRRPPAGSRAPRTSWPPTGTGCWPRPRAQHDDGGTPTTVPGVLALSLLQVNGEGDPGGG